MRRVLIVIEDHVGGRPFMATRVIDSVYLEDMLDKGSVLQTQYEIGRKEVDAAIRKARTSGPAWPVARGKR